MTAAEPDGRFDRRLELLATVLLALAAVATAWATYQSARWHGKQAEEQSASIAARVQADTSANVANRQAQIDVALFTNWVNAYLAGDRRLAAFYEDRFRPHFKPAFNAWIALKPFGSRKASGSPFDMPQYRLVALRDSDRLERLAADASDAVRVDIQRADDYTLAVVLFAVTLFFAGISTKLHQRSSRIAVLTVGYTVFLGTAIWVATFPVSVSL